MAGAAPGSEDLGRAVERLADRLRTLTDARLARPVVGGASAGDRAHVLAQSLSDAEQGIAERAAERPPAWRTMPRLGDLAVGDQVAVTGADLVASCEGLDPAESVWTRAGRSAASAVLARAVADVRELAALL
jgi:hypothetical protein